MFDKTTFLNLDIDNMLEIKNSKFSKFNGEESFFCNNLNMI